MCDYQHLVKYLGTQDFEVLETSGKHCNSNRTYLVKLDRERHPFIIEMTINNGGRFYKTKPRETHKVR